MTTFETICARRTIRFFKQEPVSDGDLRDMVDGARRTSCGGNQQHLRFVVVRSHELVKKVFEQTAWAALVKPRRTPTWGVNSPVAYIIVTAPAKVSNACHADAGAAVQSMQLIAWEKGLGCCWMGAINRSNIHELLELDADTAVLFAVAIGHPAESPMMEDCDDANQLAYYLDESDCLHVPKLCLEQVSDWK